MRTVPRIVFTSESKAALDSIQIGAPGPGEISVAIRKTQVSAGSERNAYEMGRASEKPTGYTAVGMVEEAGPDVSDYAPEIGCSSLRRTRAPTLST